MNTHFFNFNPKQLAFEVLKTVFKILMCSMSFLPDIKMKCHWVLPSQEVLLKVCSPFHYEKCQKQNEHQTVSK